MRHLPLIAGAALCLVVPMLAAEGQANSEQQTAPQPQRPSVQVGVPDGRAGGTGGAARQGGAGRGRQAGPAAPAPRSAEGRVLLGGATPKERNGVWLPVGGGPVTPANIKDVPFQPWARGVLADREINELEPHTRCKPSGVTRPFLTPYGVEFVELQELQRIFIFDIGGPHTYRTIYMDGRSHPAQLTPNYYGHSIGWWEGDTLVVDTIGFNEGFWLDRRGSPHTEQLHTIERFTRKDEANMQYDVLIDDPGAYTKPWKSGFALRHDGNVDLFEYVCQQMNYAHELMVGSNDSVDRRSPIIP
ncbi:MAG TPA: hypothetical protein VKA59_25570 [Vicinamibacterales bacterium]|jgi:hypothetical protein|nr:hypothetical protein [Vicinamibacterales bacterium]